MNWSEAFTALTSGTLVIVLIVLLFCIGPWLLFWTIGVLSTAAGTPILIPFTFETWGAGLIFLILVRGSSSKKS